MSRTSILCIAIVVFAGTILAGQATRFYPDDPLTAEPRPLAVTEPQRRTLSALLETVSSNLRTRGQRHPANGVLESQGVNTLGEVMDGDWYVNRHATRRMTLAELQRGPGHERPPDMTSTWRVLVVKPFGVNPGLLVADGRRDLYILRFDPIGSEGLATGAQMVASQFFFALGYHVAENYIVRFDRPRLMVDETGQAVSSAGEARPLIADDIDRFLKAVPEGPGRTYRAVATRIPEGRGALLGPYQMWGTRSDDPNDTVPHEHRRDLRGMFVFAAWLNFSSVRAVTTQDILATVDGVQRIRHYVVDLTKSLGSSMFDGSKQAWEGNETALPRRGAVGKSIVTLGLATPAWLREKGSDLPEVGLFGSSTFDPEMWTPADPLPPFVNRLPDDTFWAARQVMAFTDDEIRAIVQTGQYSKPAEDWITGTLIERRNRIGQTYFARLLPLDHIRVEGNTLAFDDLGVTSGFAKPRTYTITWHKFDNAKDALLETIGTGAEIPAEARALPAGSYVATRIHAGVQAMNVTVYLRRQADGFQRRRDRPVVARQERRHAATAAARRPPRLRRSDASAAGAVPDIRGQLQRHARQPVDGRRAIRAPDRLGTDHVLRHHARAATHVVDRRQRRLSRAGHRTGRDRQPNRGPIRGPGRRPAVPNLRHLEGGHPRAARQEPRVFR